MKKQLFSITYAWVIILSAAVFAQQTPPPRPPAPQQGTPSKAVPAVGGDEEMIMVQFPNNTVNEVLDLYQSLTQKNLIKDSYLMQPTALPGQPGSPAAAQQAAQAAANAAANAANRARTPTPAAVPTANASSPNLSIVSAKPLKKSDAIKLIESALILNGYTLVPSGPDSVKVINNASGKNPLQEGIRLYADTSSLPAGDQIVSYFMPLQYLEANDALPIFQQSSMLHPYGKITPVVGARALVITENASVIQEFIKLKNLIDVAPTRLETKFVQLKRADAEDVANIVTNMLNRNSSTTPAIGANRAGQAGAQNRQGGGGNFARMMANSIASSSSSFTDFLSLSAMTQILPDTRMNRVLIITHPSHFELIKNIVEELDKPGEVPAPYRRELKFMTASDLIPVLADLLKEETSLTQNAANARTQQQVQNKNNTAQQNTNVKTSTSSSNPDLLTATQVNTAPISMTVEKVRLIADNLSNAIIVIGPPESIAKASALIEQLDKRPRQVYIAALIGSLSVKNGEDYAVDVLQTFQRSGEFGLASSLQNGASPTLPSPAALATTSAFPAISGLTMYGTLAKSINVVAKALETSNRFEVTSRPSLFTANNKKAVISSGEKFAYPSSTTSDLSSSTSINTTATFMDVALKLEVIPLVNSENEVTLQIGQQNQSITGSTQVGQNTIPTIGTQLLTTTVTVQNKSTIILGGLITDNNTHEKSGIPYLSDIPLLGYLFKSDSKSDEKKELVVLLQPVILQDGQTAEDFSKSEAVKSATGQRFIDNPNIAPAEVIKKPKNPSSKDN